MSQENTSDDKQVLSTAERLRQKREENQSSAKPEDNLTTLQRGRGLLDALVFAFMLAMFIRSFVFELFMIPTGSMTPTLIGDQDGSVGILDYDGDGVDDIVYTFSTSTSVLNDLQVYLMNEDGTYKDQIFVENVDPMLILDLRRQSLHRTDMIVVNKFSYWFSTPERGDIAVFKVPHRPEDGIRFEHDKPVYIKRVVGLPGETVSFLPATNTRVGLQEPKRYGKRFGGTEVHLQANPIYIDGKPLEEERFKSLIHYPAPHGSVYPQPNNPSNNITVPEDSVLMVGDNSASSSDGRYWGGVPVNQLRGKAIFRYQPLSAMGFLK